MFRRAKRVELIQRDPRQEAQREGADDRVNDSVNTSERVHRLSEEPLDVQFVRDVTADCQGCTVVGQDGLYSRLRQALIVGVVDDHREPTVRQFPDSCTADASCPSRHYRYSRRLGQTGGHHASMSARTVGPGMPRTDP